MGVYVFDIDGTISKNGLKVHPIICERIIELSNYNKIVFASARPIRDILPMLTSELHKSLFIGCNGGISFENNRIISKSTLESNYVLSTINLMDDLGIPYVLDGEWYFSFSKSHHPFHNYIRSLSSYETSIKDTIQNGVTKILILSDTAKDKIIKSGNISIHEHGDGFYDITPDKNNKYYTLRKFIGANDYTAFGNDKNDHLVLDHATTSVYLGRRSDYQSAHYYATMDYIPTIINFLESSKQRMEKNSHAGN